MTSLELRAWIAALTVFIACPVTVSAGFIVVPSGSASVEGNAGLNVGPGNRLQQVYGASDFAGLGVIEITGLAFRPDAVGGDPFGPDTVTGLQVFLSTTSKAPDGLSLTYSENVGLDEVLVFDDDWTRSSADSPGPGGTRAFDIILTLTTPFTYDPALGNLLVDFIDLRSPLSGLPFLLPAVDVEGAVGDSVSLIVGDASTSTGTPIGSFGVVTQFAFQPAAPVVPEPASWALFGLGCVALRTGIRRQRAKRQGREIPAEQDPLRRP